MSHITRGRRDEVGEDELTQARRFSNQRAEALEKEHSKRVIAEGLIKNLSQTIRGLQKRISELERQDHCCSSCGNVDKPSQYADGC